MLTLLALAKSASLRGGVRSTDESRQRVETVVTEAIPPERERAARERAEQRAKAEGEGEPPPGA